MASTGELGELCAYCAADRAIKAFNRLQDKSTSVFVLVMLLHHSLTPHSYTVLLSKMLCVALCSTCKTANVYPIMHI